MIDALGGFGWTMFLLLEWSIRLTMLVVVPFRRSPEAAKGWLLLILFMPLPGLFLSLAIGHSAACKPPDLPDNLKPAGQMRRLSNGRSAELVELRSSFAIGIRRTR